MLILTHLVQAANFVFDDSQSSSTSLEAL